MKKTTDVSLFDEVHFMHYLSITLFIVLCHRTVDVYFVEADVFFCLLQIIVILNSSICILIPVIKVFTVQYNNTP